MTAWVALLRAINVGGASRLSMATLRAACEAARFAKVRTYIASGNVVFADDRDERRVHAALSDRLLAKTGRELSILVRSAAEMAAVAAANPFAGEPGNRIAVLFTDDAVPVDPHMQAMGIVDERLHAGARAIYIHYPNGQGRSRLKLTAMSGGTVRNLSTVSTLAGMAADLS